jgi:hypothetical protein
VALNLGGIIRLTYTVKDATGAAVNPSTATLTITQPDGTVAAGTTISLPPALGAHPGRRHRCPTDTSPSQMRSPTTTLTRRTGVRLGGRSQGGGLVGERAVVQLTHHPGRQIGANDLVRPCTRRRVEDSRPRLADRKSDGPRQLRQLQATALALCPPLAACTPSGRPQFASRLMS